MLVTKPPYDIKRYLNRQYSYSIDGTIITVRVDENQSIRYKEYLLTADRADLYSGKYFLRRIQEWEAKYNRRISLTAINSMFRRIREEHTYNKRLIDDNLAVKNVMSWDDYETFKFRSLITELQNDMGLDSRSLEVKYALKLATNERMLREILELGIDHNLIDAVLS